MRAHVCVLAHTHVLAHTYIFHLGSSELLFSNQEKTHIPKIINKHCDATTIGTSWLYIQRSALELSFMPYEFIMEMANNNVPGLHLLYGTALAGPGSMLSQTVVLF